MGGMWTARAPGPEVFSLWWVLQKSIGKSPTLGKASVSWSRQQTCRKKGDREALWPLETISPTSLLTLSTVRGGWGWGREAQQRTKEPIIE